MQLLTPLPLPLVLNKMYINASHDVLSNKRAPYGKDQLTFSGGVAGSRYQAFGAWYSSSYPIYATLVFDLNSAYYGNKYFCFCDMSIGISSFLRYIFSTNKI